MRIKLQPLSCLSNCAICSPMIPLKIIEFPQPKYFNRFGLPWPSRTAYDIIISVLRQKFIVQSIDRFVNWNDLATDNSISRNLSGKDSERF